MNSTRIQPGSRLRSWLSMAMGLSLALGLTVGCQKKCQQPATEKFKTVTGQDWRLVETTDPSPEFKKLSKTTFLIFNFATTYTGEVKKVLNNLSFDAPAKTFLYTIDSDTQSIRLLYKDPTTEEADTGSTDIDPSKIVDYSYELGRELEMTDTKKGFTYRFVPFTGTVAPDDQCEF